MITKLILPILEKITNRALQSDPHACEKINRIQHQTIEIICTDWNLRFFILCQHNQLQFETKIPHTADTTITGTLNNFVAVFMKGANTAALFQHPIDVMGNTHNIEVLRDVFKNLDIDWEEKLSQHVGDVMAHKICARFKKAQKTLKKSCDALAEQTKEFLHCETKNLVSHEQANQFYTDIATLRNDIDRMEARIARLQNHD